ncbi:PAS domain S-box protein [Oceanihabitans sp. 2_MG-2023]|uniref:PAS domain S-box protein n=1 Tax=Oceanihabitans sp. 2_MG-2023 TaxID=3062661 RepID=UPI0026E3EE8F|nr:PAS domain S-box protein [Oceanihabitans sp. 2_MG-2023]MDO6595371.1 PAS domain S-box protein [Oceanihabitans sp. 2_MG-2023]
MKTILIVDDTYENLYLLRVILEEANYIVIEAKDGKEGLVKLEENNIDLIVSDILMPIMDGYMFCQACKQDKKFKNIPFVFYTSTYTEKLDEDLALKLGAVHFLRKPTDQNKIVSVIEEVFSQDTPVQKENKKIKFTEEEVLKLYSKRLISKLEHKNLDLEKEVVVRERAEQLLVHKNEILDLIVINTPLNKVFERLLLNYESIHPDYYGSISLLQEDGIHLTLECAPSLPKEYNLAIQKVVIGNNVGSCGTSAFLKKAVIVSDITTSKLWKDYRGIATKCNLKSCWSIPILSEDNVVLGTFAIYSKSVNTPSLEEIRELSFSANLVKVAIEKFIRVKEIKEKDESYKALVDQASDAIISYTFDGTIYAFNKATYSILGYTLKEFSKFKLQDFLIGSIVQKPEIQKRIIEGESVVFERQLICKNGNILDVEISAKKQKDDKILSIARNITERKKAEQKLLESEYSLRQSQIVANIGSYIIDLNEMTWEGSTVLDSIFGIDKSFLKTIENWVSLIHPDEREDMLHYFENGIVNRIKYDREYRIINQKTKKVLWIHGIGELLFDEDSKPIKLIGTMQDVTSRKHAEIKIRESEKSLLVAQKIAKIGSFDLDLVNKIASSSSVFNEIIGVEVNKKISFSRWQSIVHPEDRLLVKQNMLESQKNTQKFDLEYRIITFDEKELKWVHALGVIIYKDKVPTNFVGTIQDITDRKKAEIDLKIANDFSSNLLQSMHEGLVAINLNSEIISVNPAFCEMTGFSESELLGVKRPFPYSPPELKKKNDANYKLLLSGKNKSNYENTYMRKNGERFLVDVQISSVYGEDGEKIANFSTVQDITERRKAEIDLKLAKEFNDKLITSMQEGLLMLDMLGKIVKVNESFCSILGYSEEELIGLELPYPFAKPEDFEIMQEIKALVTKDQAPSFQLEFIRKNGEKFHASFLAGTIKNDSNEVIAIFATVKDVSEEEKLKDTLKERAKKSIERKNVILELANFVGSDYKVALKELTKLSAKTLNVGRVSVWKFNNKKNEILCDGLFDLKSQTYESGVVLKKEENPVYFESIIKNKTISINDTFTNNITKAFKENYLLPLGITSMLDVAIQVSNDLYGVLCFEHIESKRVWTGDEEEFATSLANLVSLMVESAERKAAENELKSEKEFSDKLVTSLREGLSVVDLNGVHIKVNPALCEMTGFSEEELLGIKAPFPYWPPEELDYIYNKFNSPLKGLGVTANFVFMRKNGERFPCILKPSVITNNDGEVIAYFSTITDITLRVEAENVLKQNIIRSDQRKNTIIELANLIGEDFNDSLKKIATTAAKTLDAALVTIWKYKNNNTELLSKVFYNYVDDILEREQLEINNKEYPNYFKALEENTSINITDVLNDPITKEFAKEFLIPNKITSRIDVIIYGRSNNYGVISFECTRPKRVFSVEEESFANSIASIVSLMVESSERTLAENKITLTNQKLTEANKELNTLRDQLEQENVYLRNELDLVFNYEEMVYGSEVFSNVLTEVEKVAPTIATVLLLGESGTGKELLARAIHNTSLRNNKPLIKVNCSAIPRELIESELFGHKKGSFTGAVKDKIGKFELADKGTLFLDEIGELPLDMQPKILRFLQEGEIEVVGSVSGSKKLDVRVIAATNRDLKKEIEKKQFREDLYFRLNVFPVQVPSLRNRKEDIPLLVEHFVDKFNKAYGKSIKYITDDAMSQLKAYDWPGNIRELEYLIERSLILSTKDTLVIPGFESSTQKVKSIHDKDLTLNSVQRNHILQVLEQCNWKISGKNGASEILGLKASTLRDRMTKLNISKSIRK